MTLKGKQGKTIYYRDRAISISKDGIITWGLKTWKTIEAAKKRIDVFADIEMKMLKLEKLVNKEEK